MLRGLPLKRARRLTFDAEVAIEAAMPRNQANDGLGEMDVEVVANDIPPYMVLLRFRLAMPSSARGGPTTMRSKGLGSIQQ